MIKFKNINFKKIALISLVALFTAIDAPAAMLDLAYSAVIPPATWTSLS